MKSSLVKVLHPIMGKPMLSYPIEVSLNALRAEKTVVVVGYQGDRVQEAFSENRLVFVSQHPQLGSGHAVMCTEDVFRGYDGTILILYGDVPLVQDETLTELVAFHRQKGSTLTITTTRLPDPTGYGRVVRREGEQVERIVEENDASPLERGIDEINAGIYCVEAPFLFSALKRVKPDNRQGEYYLTDIVEVGCQEGTEISAFQASDPDQFLGINTRVDLARSHEILRQRYLQRWMLDGVTIVDPGTTSVEGDTILGQDTVIHANTVIQGRTVIGSRCVIGPNCLIVGSEIEDDVTIKAFSVVEQSRIAEGATIGPFSRLRPQSRVLEDAKIGSFVEIKNR